MVWSRGRITVLRRLRPGAPGVRDAAVFPGFVNAHAHLQLAPLRRPVRPFVPWIREVLAARGGATQARDAAVARASLAALRAEGTTAVGEIDASGAGARALRELRFAGRCYRELLGFHLDARAARALVAERWNPGTVACPGGLSPHAPYSVSAALFAAAAARTPHLAIHCAETEEEQRFLHAGGGPFAELLESLGRLPPGWRPPRCGAVRWLARAGALAASTLLIHCQHLERGDVETIARAGAKIAVCPGTIRWFRRDPPPVPRWLAAGIPVALGTDSAASNEGMSMRNELSLAARAWPGLAPATLLAMATANGGQALGRPGLGRLRRGGRADLVLVEAGRSAAATVEALVHGEARTLDAWLGGAGPEPHD